MSSKKRLRVGKKAAQEVLAFYELNVEMLLADGYDAESAHLSARQNTFDTFRGDVSVEQIAAALAASGPKENPLSTPALWVGAAALTAFGVYTIVRAIQSQTPADNGSYPGYDPPITLHT